LKETDLEPDYRKMRCERQAPLVTIDKEIASGKKFDDRMVPVMLESKAT